MKRKAILFFATITLVFTSLFLYKFLNPFKNILSSNGEEQVRLLEFYDNLTTSSKQEILINKLMNTNDIQTLNSISIYCLENRKCQNLDKLNEKLKYLDGLPQDSSWVIKIGKVYSRRTGMSMLKLPNNFRDNVVLLNKYCNSIESN